MPAFLLFSGSRCEQMRDAQYKAALPFSDKLDCYDDHYSYHQTDVCWMKESIEHLFFCYSLVHAASR